MVRALPENQTACMAQAHRHTNRNMMQEEQLRNRILLLLGMAGFMAMANNWAITPILSVIAADLQVSIPKAGLLVTAYMIPFGLFQIIFGPLADRYGKKEVIMFGMVFFTITTGICTFAQGWMGLAIFRAVSAVSAAAIVPISMALIGDIFPMQHRQKAIGTFMGLSILGQGMSMVISGAVAQFIGWRGVFVIYALLALIPTVFILTLFRRLPSVKNPESAVLRPYLDLLKDGNSLTTYLIIVLEGILVIGSFSYCGVYLVKIHHLDAFHTGIIMTTYGLMSVIAGRLSGWLARRIGSHRSVPLGLGVAAMGILLIWLAGTHLWVCVLAIALLGLGLISAHTTLVTRASEFAQKSRGAAMSLVAFSLMGSGGIGTAIGAKILAVYSLPTLFKIYGIALAATAVITWIMLREQNAERQPAWASEQP